MNNLILIGMMGCGKSTVGRLAAEKLGLAFADTDERIERASGRTQKVLLRALGEQIDLLNIIHVLRLKTYFPQTEPETYLRVLFPFHYRLNPDFTRALCAAPGVDDVFALLRDSPYRDCFDGVAVGAVEEYYQRAICRFNKRQLAAVPPSIYTAVAYLELKELELSVLINVIESVKYGVPYRAELADLVGQ